MVNMQREKVVQFDEMLATLNHHSVPSESIIVKWVSSPAENRARAQSDTGEP
jgi:hypothetical protein